MNNLEIEAIRTTLGLSKPKLALEIGVTPNTIANWYNGKPMPKTAEYALRYLLAEHNRKSENGSRGIPYYADLPVSAGLCDVLVSDAPPSGYLSLPGVTADALFPVVGCSMQPEIEQGDIIGVVAVDNWETLDPDKTYLVITNTDRMIKHLVLDLEDDRVIWCISPNCQKFKVSADEVRYIYRVTFCGKIKAL